ncbi:hypothetical protein HYX05_00855 [Candidatus Woesearchaeota archaeon]|nr:hypothetical protein [Candidatus Woesearchaeota archaeon]
MDPEKKRLKAISKKLNLENIFIGITILLGIVVILNIFLTYNLNKDIKKSAEAAQESLKPAKIELTLIKNSKCNDCFDISTIVSHVKNANVIITKEAMFEFDSKEGKAITSKYDIEKIPTVVITGEIEKVNIQGLEKTEDALLFKQANPPYTSTATGKIEGRVVLYHLKDASCQKCSDLNVLISQITNPPFINLTTGKLRGIVNIVYLTDKSCTECYNASQHREILANAQGFAVKLEKEETYDISDAKGKELIAKYNITQVPTVILSDEISAYPSSAGLKQFYSVENDGFYVFRLLSVVGTYKDLSTGQIVKPAEETQ